MFNKKHNHPKQQPNRYEPWWVNEAKNAGLSFVFVLALTALVLAP